MRNKWDNTRVICQVHYSSYIGQIVLAFAVQGRSRAGIWRQLRGSYSTDAYLTQRELGTMNTTVLTYLLTGLGGCVIFANWTTSNTVYHTNNNITKTSDISLLTVHIWVTSSVRQMANSPSVVKVHN